MSRTQWRASVCVIGIVGVAFGMRSFARGVAPRAPSRENQANSSTAPSEPVKLTNQEDRQRMMDQLKITMFPSGPGAYLASTYDEATANPYPTLPDPLVMNNGAKVTTPAQWKARRAEILELFDREVYGRRPKVMPKVKWEVVSTTTGTTDSGSTLFGAASPPTGSAVITKQLIGHVDNSAYPAITVNIQASLSTPANAKGPVPVVLMFGGGGPPAPGAAAQPNPCAQPGAPARGVPPAATSGAGAVAAGGGAPATGRAVGRAGAPGGATPEPSAQEQIIKHGWGYATINSGSVQADCGAGLTVGIIGLVNKGQPRKLDDWGVLSAWGWGMSKVLDYFETDKAVDAKRVAVQGHSRAGKAALVAMAYDDRFLTGFISSSGEGGAKLHRRKYGELIENLAALNEYHWMAGNFLKYAGRWDTLPVDSHELVALCAPRPVFLSAGKGPDANADGTTKMLKPGDPGVLLSRGPVELQAANINDAWVDAKGTFLAGVGAGPVYRLLGKKDLGTTDFPKIETALVTGDIGFRQHAAGHTPGPNWPVFLDFAAKYFDAPDAAATSASKKR
jgi:hypothetical protein